MRGKDSTFSRSPRSFAFELIDTVWVCAGRQHQLNYLLSPGFLVIHYHVVKRRIFIIATNRFGAVVQEIGSDFVVISENGIHQWVETPFFSLLYVDVRFFNKNLDDIEMAFARSILQWSQATTIRLVRVLTLFEELGNKIQPALQRCFPERRNRK
jgi:hypothetical protein